jgi:hypothetical protein
MAGAVVHHHVEAKLSTFTSFESPEASVYNLHLPFVVLCATHWMAVDDCAKD